MVVIKQVKDAGQEISSRTQQGIKDKMTAVEIFPPDRQPLAKLVVTDDGTNNAQNIKRIFALAVLRHLKLDNVDEMTQSRLEMRMATVKPGEFPFVAMVVDEPDDDFVALKNQIRKLKEQSPESYLMVLAPCGKIWELPENSPRAVQIRAIKNECALVNTSLGDYTDVNTMQKMLAQKVPLPKKGR